MTRANVAQADVRRAEIYDAFAKVTQALCGPAASSNHPDPDIRDRVCDSLSILSNAAVVAGFLRENVVLRLAAPRGGFSDVELERVENHLAGQARVPAEIGTDRFQFEIGGIEVLGSWFREKVIDVIDGLRKERVRLKGFAALAFRNISKENRDLFISLHSKSTAGLMFEVLENHTRLFLPFAPKISERYWNQASGTQPDSLAIPWLQDHVRTVTLAFDLRKSTFCMENADRLDLFARWLDQLVQILMRLGHHFGGAFDKFTGDGGLVHFEENACRSIDASHTAVDAAVEAAIAMQDATVRHLERLRKFLYLNSRRLGAGIGIGIGDTCWSLDQRNNPIIVGRGVVHACRLMNEAKPGAIRLTNLAYRELSSAHQKLFNEIDFVTKEHPAELEVTAWQMLLSEKPDVASRNVSVVDSVCDAVYSANREGPSFPATAM